MEKELEAYIEKLKSHTFETEETKKAILKIKKCLDKEFDCYELDLADGDITKQEIVAIFLQEYEENKENEEDDFQSTVTILFSKYEACKKIIKMGRKNRSELNALINIAKQKEENKKDTLYDTICMDEEMETCLRGAIRGIKELKKIQGKKEREEVTSEEILDRIFQIKQETGEELKTKLIHSLQKRICFLENYGYMDEYIQEANTSLENAGLSGIKQVKRNPFLDGLYDGKGNIINQKEIEDMGVIDMFETENLEKLSPQELFIMEAFWKSKYFLARLELFEGLSTINFLNIWPMIMDENSSVIENIDDKKIVIALKRDLALTYLVQNREAITPELEQRYIRFLQKNGMAQTETTMEEIDKQSKELKEISKIANDIALGECVLVDKLLNKELEVQNWGTVDESEFEDSDPNTEKIIIAMDKQSFRGPLAFSIDENSINEFLKKKNRNDKQQSVKLPKYKGKLDESYSKVMASLFLPTSVYFKKYINGRYQENPNSTLLTKLALDFAGGKRIKEKKLDREIR